MKKSAKVQLYFALDFGMFEFFPCEPQSRIFGARLGEKDRGLSTCKL
jgi:hypothetical protein